MAVPDSRFDYLVAKRQAKSAHPALLTVTDIADLVKGAHEGKGLPSPAAQPIPSSAFYSSSAARTRAAGSSPLLRVVHSSL